MSIDRCKNCDRVVDTDFDLGCYQTIYDKHYRIVSYQPCLCQKCREKEETCLEPLQ